MLTPTEKMQRIKWNGSAVQFVRSYGAPGRIYRRFEEKRPRGPSRPKGGKTLLILSGKNSSRSLPLTKKIEAAAGGGGGVKSKCSNAHNMFGPDSRLRK